MENTIPKLSQSFLLQKLVQTFEIPNVLKVIFISSACITTRGVVGVLKWNENENCTG